MNDVEIEKGLCKTCEFIEHWREPEGEWMYECKNPVASDVEVNELGVGLTQDKLCSVWKGRL